MKIEKDKVYAIPVKGKDEKRPIAVFEIDLTDDQFSTSAEIVNSVLNDYDECGQAQEDVLADNPNAEDVWAFYQKWNKYHLKDLAKLDFDDLAKDINQLAEKHVIKEFDTDPGLTTVIDIWMQAFKDDAQAVFQPQLDIWKEAQKQIDNDDDPDDIIDDLQRNLNELDPYYDLPGLLVDYDIVDTDWVNSEMEAGVTTLADLNNIDTSAEWHCKDYSGYDDDLVRDQLSEAIDEQIEKIEDYLD